jgi:hypothetical protein
LQILISFFYRCFCASPFFNSETAKQRNSETAKQRNSETANKGELYLKKDSHKKISKFSLCVCFIFQFSINCRTFYAPSSNDGIFKDGWFSKPQASANNFDGTRRAAYFENIGILQQFMFSKESGGIDNLTTLINKTNESQRALIEASIRKLEAEAKKTDSETEKVKADTELEKQKQQTLKLQQGQSSVSPNSPSGSNANQITVVVPETNCETPKIPKIGTQTPSKPKSCK